MQRAVERRCIPTISISVALDVTHYIKPPRAVFVPFMMGHHFGVPFHTPLQQHIINEALALVVAARESGEVRSLPITWAQARREGTAIKRALESGKRRRKARNLSLLVRHGCPAIPRG